MIGATNRPQDVDKAVLRRMPCMFQIDLPKETERKQILELILKNEHLEADVDLDEIASLTPGYSGSDLKDLCRRAAMKSLKELNESLFSMSKETTSNSTDEQQSFNIQSSLSFSAKQILSRARTSGSRAPELRSMTMDDFIHAVNSIDNSRTGIKPNRSRIPLD